MKNITLSVEEEVISAVRRYAAERDRTVNGLVRDYLREIASREDKVKAARKQIRELSLQSTARLGKARWTREELHER
jgi:hypothetical protein